MAQAYPLHIERGVEQRGHLRTQGALIPQPVNDNTQGGRCPVCYGPASVAPVSSEYRGGGIVRHHWLCGLCNHQWFTVLQVRLLRHAPTGCLPY